MKITKKLRDVTPEEYNEYSNRNCNSKKCKYCIFYKSNCSAEDRGGGWIFNKDLYSDKFLDQTIEIEIPDILTKEEKEYLSAVIKPFRNKVKNIIKFSCAMNSHSYIEIVYDDDTWGKDMAIVMPPFKKDTMYKNMKLGEKYKLEELGL